jgi:glycosyltransferase involved in cell wall biosynthesis
MHICLFHFYSNRPNPVYQEIAAALTRRGHLVWIGAPNQDQDLEWRADGLLVGRQGGPLGRVPSWANSNGSLRWIVRLLADLSFMFAVRRFLRNSCPDVIQINPARFSWIIPQMMPKEVLCLLDIRQINEEVSPRISVRLREKWRVTFSKIAARFLYDHTCFCHEGAAKKILGAGWRKKGTVVPVGVDERFLSLEWHSSMSIRESDIPVRFVYVGSLSRLRSLERLVFAARAVAYRTDRFRVDLIGPDATEGYYARLIKELGVDHLMRIKPAVEYTQVPYVLTQYDVALAYVPDRPTWHYQPTIKVLEYRALGMPIISTDVASHRGTVQQERNGLLVKDSVDALAAAFCRFIEEPGFLRQTLLNAQAMRQGTTWDQVAEMYERTVYCRPGF